MERSEIYKAIDSERDYQDKKWGNNSLDNSIADYILYMEKHIQNAKDALYELESKEAREFLRKVTALGVACFEQHGVEPRI